MKVLKSGYILKCNDFHLCAKVFVNFTMVYIFTFGKLAYIILQSNVDIISKNFPKKKKTIQVFMDLGILSYKLVTSRDFKPFLRLNFDSIYPQA